MDISQKYLSLILSDTQKQSSIGVLWKRCSENMQQIYRRTPMTKCDFNQVAKQLSRGVLRKWFSENMQQIHRRAPMTKCDFALRHGCSAVNLLHIFRATFPKNTSGRLLLDIVPEASTRRS